MMVTGGDMSMQQTCTKRLTVIIYTPTAACTAKHHAKSFDPCIYRDGWPQRNWISNFSQPQIYPEYLPVQYYPVVAVNHASD